MSLAYEAVMFIKKCKQESRTNLPTEKQRQEFIEKYGADVFRNNSSILEWVWANTQPVYK